MIKNVNHNKAKREKKNQEVMCSDNAPAGVYPLFCLPFEDFIVTLHKGIAV